MRICPGLFVHGATRTAYLCCKPSALFSVYYSISNLGDKLKSILAHSTRHMRPPTHLYMRVSSLRLSTWKQARLCLKKKSNAFLFCNWNRLRDLSIVTIQHFHIEQPLPWPRLICSGSNDTFPHVIHTPVLAAFLARQGMRKARTDAATSPFGPCSFRTCCSLRRHDHANERAVVS